MVPDITILRDFASGRLYTNLRVWAPPEETLLTEQREATLVLTREDDNENTEFLDLYNDYYPTGNPPETQYRIRMGKKGTGMFRDCVVDQVDNNTTPGIRTTLMIIKPDGNVGIATNTPARRLHVVGASTDNYQLRLEGAAGKAVSLEFYEVATRKAVISACATTVSIFNGSQTVANAIHINQSTGNTGTGTASPSEKLHVIGNGLADAWLTTSDDRLKKNVTTLEGTLRKALALRSVRYELKDGADAAEGRQEQIGLMAQELEREFPELVATCRNGYKAVAYDKISAARPSSSNQRATGRD